MSAPSETATQNPYDSPHAADVVEASGTSRPDLFYFYSGTNVLLGALAMVGTLPGRTHGLGLITEPLLADLHLDRDRFADINMLATLLGALACFPAGWLIDRLGTRWSYALVVFALGAVCWVMSGVAGVVGLVVLVTLTRALGQSALSIVSMAVVGKWFQRHVGLAMSVYSVLVGVGFGLAFRTVGGAVRTEGWRDAWEWIGLALMFGLAPLAALLVRSDPARYVSSRGRTGHYLGDWISLVLLSRLVPLAGLLLLRRDSAPNVAGHEDAPAAPLPQTGFSFAAALGTPAFWIFALSASLYGLVVMGMALFSEAILREHHFDQQTYHYVLEKGFYIGLGGQLLAGALARFISLARMLAGAMFVYAAALLWLTQVETLQQLYGYVAMASISGGVIMVVFFAIWPQAFGRASLGRIQGAAQMLTVLASAVGPKVFSQCYARYESYSPALYVLAPIVVAFGVAAWLVRTPQPGEGQA